LADLRAEFEKAAGQDLKWFFDQWFFRKGAPEFVMSSRAEAHGADWMVKGKIRQIREIYRVAAEVVFLKDGARETRIIEIGTEETGFSFVLPFKPDEVIFDPDYKILRWTDEFKK
jgi:aminopeptidase N